jgi:hypothetical protein
MNLLAVNEGNIIIYALTDNTAPLFSALVIKGTLGVAYDVSFIAPVNASIPPTMVGTVLLNATTTLRVLYKVSNDMQLTPGSYWSMYQIYKE